MVNAQNNNNNGYNKAHTSPQEAATKYKAPPMTGLHSNVGMKIGSHGNICELLPIVANCTLATLIVTD